MTFRDAFWQTWGPVISWILPNLVIILIVIACIVAGRVTTKELKERLKSAKTRAAASTAALKAAGPKTSVDCAKEMLEFFIAKMEAAGKPGLSRASFNNSIDQKLVHITKGDPCWQTNFALRDNPWYRCLIVPSGKWTLIGHVPPPFDVEETVNGPFKMMTEEWLDALLEGCALIMETHLPHEVDELVRIANGEN